MKYKAIFYLFFIVFFSINAFGSDLTFPKPLNNNDETLLEIKALISQDDWQPYLETLDLKEFFNLKE